MRICKSLFNKLLQSLHSANSLKSAYEKFEQCDFLFSFDLLKSENRAVEGLAVVFKLLHGASKE